MPAFAEKDDIEEDDGRHHALNANGELQDDNSLSPTYPLDRYENEAKLYLIPYPGDRLDLTGSSFNTAVLVGFPLNPLNRSNT